MDPFASAFSQSIRVDSYFPEAGHVPSHPGVHRPSRYTFPRKTHRGRFANAKAPSYAITAIKVDSDAERGNKRSVHLVFGPALAGAGVSLATTTSACEWPSAESTLVGQGSNESDASSTVAPTSRSRTPPCSAGSALPRTQSEGSSLVLTNPTSMSFPDYSPTWDLTANPGRPDSGIRTFSFSSEPLCLHSLIFSALEADPDLSLLSLTGGDSPDDTSSIGSMSCPPTPGLSAVNEADGTGSKTLCPPTPELLPLLGDVGEDVNDVDLDLRRYCDAFPLPPLALLDDGEVPVAF